MDVLLLALLKIDPLFITFYVVCPASFIYVYESVEASI